jgi:hypothetical protein
MSRQSAPALPESHVILPGLEEVMGYWAVGAPVTLMLTVGIANGFNLIDGVNGLAALTALVAATSLSVISDTAGLPGLSPINLILAAALIEFLALNVPAGRILRLNRRATPQTAPACVNPALSRRAAERRAATGAARVAAKGGPPLAMRQLLAGRSCCEYHI